MKIFTGKELMESFGGISKEMEKLGKMSDGHFHLDCTFGFKTFSENGDKKEIIKKFNKWLKNL